MASTLTVEDRSQWDAIRDERGLQVGWRVKVTYISSGSPSTISADVPIFGILHRIHWVFGGTKPTNTTTKAQVFHPKVGTTGTALYDGAIDTTNADYPSQENLDQPFKNVVHGLCKLQVSGDSASGSSATLWVEYLFV